MYLRTFLILVVLGLVAIFAAINWDAFVAPTRLSLGFGVVDAPLGLILIAVLVLLTILFLVYVAYMQSVVILDNRRHARELQTQRELADQAEASRLNQLQSLLQGELQTLKAQTEGWRIEMLARVERAERNLQVALEQINNSLAASIGELEDKVERYTSKP
jgi:uncharacterized integral membrane protein